MRLETPRLLLRPWEDRDRADFAAINADPEVRRYYHPSVLTPAETDALIDEAAAGLAEDGFGFVAVERKADGALVGGAGLSRPGPEVPGGHPAEIGWILGRAFWRQGYATEIGRACLDAAWARFGLPSVPRRSTRRPAAPWSGWAWPMSPMAISRTSPCRRATRCGRMCCTASPGPSEGPGGVACPNSRSR
jgi:hypothetical protein